ncbi:DUF6508 domain-containing protein [Olsenella uli]|uniref:DUF6508 domain-containing protein n=1 Tax=Olsenella uli TaxID=133926 RepID=UPI003D7B1356
MRACITWCVRGDRFCDGCLRAYVECGFVDRCLLRLKELDEGWAPPRWSSVRGGLGGARRACWCVCCGCGAFACVGAKIAATGGGR